MTETRAQQSQPHEATLFLATKTRQALEKQCRDQIQRQDQQWQHAAKNIFDQQTGLQLAIQEQVMPALAKLQCPTGRGSGFFFTPEWLITNAHVTPGRERLRETKLTTMHQPQPLKTHPSLSFSRPVADDLPDIAVHNVASSAASSLPLWFPENECLEKEILFCIDQYAPPGDQFKALRLIENDADDINQVYQCTSDSPPQPGASGTPILKAKLIRSNNETRWCFAIEGLLYASDQHDVSQIHAISIKEELDLIRQHIFTIEQGERARQMDEARRSLNNYRPDESNQPEPPDIYSQARNFSALFKAANATLRPLWYSHMVAINQSLLLKKNRNKAMQKKMAAADYADDITEEDLQKDFDDLLAAIGTKPTHRFPSSGRPQTLMKSTYFRLDFEGKNPVFFSIEDNISHHGNPINDQDGKTYSSVFAKVKILQPEKSIAGPLLMQILTESATRRFDADANIRRTAVIYGEDQPTIEQSKKKKGKQKKQKTIQMIMKRKKQKRQQESPPSALPKVADTEFLVIVNHDKTNYRVIEPQGSFSAPSPASFSG